MVQQVDPQQMRADLLIDKHLEPHPTRLGQTEWRLKERGVPVWVLIAFLASDGENLAQVAEEYGVSREAVEAARAYYLQHKPQIDARIAANSAA